MTGGGAGAGTALVTAALPLTRRGGGHRLRQGAGSSSPQHCSPRTRPGPRPPRTGRPSSWSPGCFWSVSSPTKIACSPPAATRWPGWPPTESCSTSGLRCSSSRVTTLLNLDTSVTFLTPVLVYAARSRGAGEEAPLLYACLLLSNAGSLLLPGSNLTNLIVLGHLHLSGRDFLAHMALPALAAAVVTALVVGAVLPPRPAHHHRPDHRAGASRARSRPRGDRRRDGARRGPARAGAPGGGGRAWRRSWSRRRRCAGPAVARTTRAPARAALRVLGVPVLVGLFGLAVALGTLGRSWSGPATLLSHLDAWGTAAVAA